jgi:hypothetical protein
VAVTVLPGGQGWALLTSAARAGMVVSAVARALGASPEELDRSAKGADRAEVAPGLIEAVSRGEPFTPIHTASPAAVWNGVLDALAARTWDAVERLQQAADHHGPTDPGAGAGRPSGAGGGPSGVRPGVGSGERLGIRDGVGRERLGREGGEAVASAGLVVFGGGSRSRPWLQAKADARPEIPVWRSTAVEAVARGAALSAGVAAGWWPTAADGPGIELERIPTGSQLP